MTLEVGSSVTFHRPRKRRLYDGRVTFISDQYIRVVGAGGFHDIRPEDVRRVRKCSQ